ncbi:MAG: hypothetical protein KC496_01860, partial [Anaerolineae bacterium]|nr:hypothetical protein [Anaerolineae bacterium]
WSNEAPNVVCLDYSAPVETWEEYHAAMQKAYDLAQAHPQTVYFLHNPRHTAMPDGNPFPELQRAMQNAPRNTGAILMVITNVFARRMMELMLKIANADSGYYFIASEDDAYALLEELKQRV